MLLILPIMDYDSMRKGEMNELALFAGAGGGILGGHLLGWKTVAACEIEDYPRETLLRRQLDGCIPRFPIWDDICTFDGKQFRGKVDIITGGFPCQDISAAGKGAGITGERSGLWGEMARVINEVRPRFAFMENSPMLTSRGLGTVLGDLAEMGYDARWCVLGADDAGAPHRRKRIWILAYAVSAGERWDERKDEIKKNVMAYTSMHGQLAAEIRSGINERSNDSETREETACKSSGLCSAGINEDAAYADEARLERFQRTGGINEGGREKPDGSIAECGRISWWDSDPAEVCNTSEPRFQERAKSQMDRPEEIAESKRSTCNGEIRPTEPAMGRVAHGVANRVDKLKAIGNGQVPAVAAIAFLKLSEDLI